MRKTAAPERSMEKLRKNRRPNRSIQRIVHRLPGAAATEMMNWLMKTWRDISYDLIL